MAGGPEHPICHWIAARSWLWKGPAGPHPPRPALHWRTRRQKLCQKISTWRVSKARLRHQQEARRMADDIADLEQQLDDKFQEILDAVATQLKLGKYDDLSDADQERVENEAETAADRWMDDNEAGPKEPKTPFEKLLADYAALALKFPDEDDEDEDDDEKEDDHKPRK